MNKLPLGCKITQIIDNCISPQQKYAYSLIAKERIDRPRHQCDQGPKNMGKMQKIVKFLDKQPTEL